MHTSSRFAVAVHTLAFLAARGSETNSVTSERVAESVNTNPVVIRRILGALRGAHLVTSQPGNGGGWTLTRRPNQITLRHVYRAVEDEPLFALHRRPPNAHCDVGRNMQGILDDYFKEAERAMEARLDKVTLAEVMQEVGLRGRESNALGSSTGETSVQLSMRE